MKQELSTTQNTPSELMALAIQKGVDTTQLKELMDLQERWEKKEAKKLFFDALSRFQTIAPVIKKNRTAKIQSQKGYYSYKFADLGAIVNAIKKALSECGLSYRWEFEEKGGILSATCLISHLAGHTEKTSMEAGKDASGGKNNIQQSGSTQTYLQRYTLIGALGLATADEDIDGKGSETELTEDEILDQWQQQVDQTRTKIELSGLYMKNKKAVDGNPKVQAIFKAREAQLKQAKSVNGQPAMP